LLKIKSTNHGDTAGRAKSDELHLDQPPTDENSMYINQVFRRARRVAVVKLSFP